MAEMPALNNLMINYEDNDQIQFWAFSADSVLKGHNNFHFDHFLVSEEVRNKFYVQSFPKTIVVDQAGVIRFIKPGAEIGDNANLTKNLVRQIDRLLEFE